MSRIIHFNVNLLLDEFQMHIHKHPSSISRASAHRHPFISHYYPIGSDAIIVSTIPKKRTLICIFIKTRQIFNAFQFELIYVNMAIFSAQRTNEPRRKVEMRRGIRTDLLLMNFFTRKILFQRFFFL